MAFDFNLIVEILSDGKSFVSGTYNVAYDDDASENQSDIEFSFSGKRFALLFSKTCGEALSQARIRASCREFLDTFTQIYVIGQQLIGSEIAGMSYEQLIQYEKNWNDYFTKSRTQFPWELTLNYLINKDSLAYYGEPPSGQWILLHPSPIVSHMGDAPDGSNTNGGAMIELLGYNRWNTEKWYQPSGISLVSIYSDRAEVDDWGTGVAVHFNNEYTIGYAKHDDEESVFVSVDLWELFVEKKKQLQEWREKFK